MTYTPKPGEHDVSQEEIKEYLDDMKTTQERDRNHFRKFGPTM